VTFATLWAVVGFAAGFVVPALFVMASRMLLALVSSLLVLNARSDRWMLLFVPLRDMWSATIWIAGLLDRTVYWRDFALELSTDGRILRSTRLS
jgi:hypothetical protein